MNDQEEQLIKVSSYMEALEQARLNAENLITSFKQVKMFHDVLVNHLKNETPEKPNKHAMNHSGVFAHHSQEPSLAFAEVAKEHLDELEHEATRLLVEEQITSLIYAIGQLRTVVGGYIELTPDDLAWKVAHIDARWQYLSETITRYDKER